MLCCWFGAWCCWGDSGGGAAGAVWCWSDAWCWSGVTMDLLNGDDHARMRDAHHFFKILYDL